MQGESKGTRKTGNRGALKGSLKMPADKSIAHRSAMFAAISEPGMDIVIRNYSSAEDPHSTLSCLKKLGVPVNVEGDTVTITPVGRDGIINPKEELDCGNSGTTMRLMAGILAGAGTECILTGDESLSGRPMSRIINPLREMGAKISARDDKYAPLKIIRNSSGSLKPIHYKLPVASAQVKSCVLLAGLFADDPTTVEETVPSRDHTERMLGLPVEIRHDGARLITSSKKLKLNLDVHTVVPGDFSAAAFWLVAALINPGSSVKLENTGINPTRTGALGILQRMGATISVDPDKSGGKEPVATITVKSSKLKGTSLNQEEIPNAIDEIPVLAVAMAFAEGTSSIRGAEELRYKETDRIAAVASILKTAGADFKEFPDGIEIYGNPNFVPQPGVYQTWKDHRIAMSAAVMASRSKTGEESEVEFPECVGVSYPGFWEDFDKLS